ncbi:Protein of unknown function [Gryllus bimaculatus]|nr:Protein of unknown function [Gryllus bimaculatus]
MISFIMPLNIFLIFRQGLLKDNTTEKQVFLLPSVNRI